MNFRLNGQVIGLSGLFVALAALTSSPTLADDLQLTPYEASLDGETIAQVNSVTQLRDVSPQDWAFEALRNLVENYGCIEGYPDRTYRGNRPLSRYEFAAGMNSCLEALESRLVEGETVIIPSTQTNQPVGISTQDMFNRAFYDQTGRFYDITSISGQANLIFGWRRLPNSFFDTMIVKDAELFGKIYEDAFAQQMAHPIIRTRDLPNPYETSVFQNPDYVRPASAPTTREIRF